MTKTVVKVMVIGNIKRIVFMLFHGYSREKKDQSPQTKMEIGSSIHAFCFIKSMTFVVKFMPAPSPQRNIQDLYN